MFELITQVDVGNIMLPDSFMLIQFCQFEIDVTEKSVLYTSGIVSVNSYQHIVIDFKLAFNTLQNVMGHRKSSNYMVSVNGSLCFINCSLAIKMIDISNRCTLAEITMLKCC